ncbi:MAG: CDP-glycerol glycerophosphotransferase family protein [Lachnospiraceae bacterium]
MENIEENYSYYCECINNLPLNKNIVFFESHNSMDFASNMIAIAKELSGNTEYVDYKIRISTLPENNEKIMQIVDKYQIKYEMLVVRETKEYFETLATAGYLITDVAYYPLYRKRNEQICISTWHGTPLKTLGFTFTEDSYVAANQKRGFTLADYIIAPNIYTWECLRESYQLEGLFKGKVVYGGYPRNSVFFNIDRRNLIKRELNPDDKKIIVFMPTWRGKVTNIDGVSQSQELQVLLSFIDKKLPCDYIVWTKLHRLNDNELNYSDFENIRPFPSGYETYDVLNIADVLVTDYSSVLFDFSNTKKKIILYCYDKKKYVEERGLYFSIEELPFPIVTNEEELVIELCKNKSYNDEKFIKTFNEFDCLESTTKICKDIFKCGHNSIMTIENNNVGEKILIFVGDLNQHNATDSLFFELDKFKEHYTCYITYLNHLFLNNKWYKLLQFFKFNKMPFYMFACRYSYYSQKEAKVEARITNNIQNQIVVSDNDWCVMEAAWLREYERFHYNSSFNTFVRYAGQDIESLKFFRVFKGNKVLYIHDIMMDKVENNLEYKIYLFRAMEVADEINYANHDVFCRAEEAFTKLSNKKIVLQLY